MTSSSNPVPPISTALVPYDPTLPHVSLKAHLEAAADKAVSHSLEVAKFESQHLSLEGRLTCSEFAEDVAISFLRDYSPSIRRWFYCASLSLSQSG